MKPFRIFVNEVFEKDAKWRQYWRGPEKEFGIDVPGYGVRFSYDGAVYMVHIIANNNDPDDTTIWSVDFGLYSGPKGAVASDPYVVTGTGNSIPVFSIVLDILMAFIQKRSPKHIIFSAKETNRANLYKRMISSLIPKFGLNYKLTSQYKADDGTTDFVLSRVDPEPDELNEVFNTRVQWNRSALNPEDEELEPKEVKFKLKDHTYFIKFYPRNVSERYAFKNSSPPRWELEFYRENNPNWAYDLAGDSKNHFSFFGFLLDVVDEFLKRNDVKRLDFTAKGESRIKLYTKLADIMSKKYPDYQLVMNPQDHDYFDFEYKRFAFFRKDNPYKPKYKLNEVFNTKIDWDRNDIKKKSSFVKFELNNKKYGLYFSYNYDNDAVEVVMANIKRQTEYGGDSLSFEILGDMENHFSLFGVIVDILFEYVKIHNPRKFYFSAHEKSRVSLYTRMSKTLATKIPEYSLSISKDFAESFFTFTRKDLDESADLNESKINWNDINVYGYIKPNGKMIVKGADSRGKFNHYRIAKNLGYSDHRDPIFKNGWIRFDHYHGWDKLPSGVHDYAGYEFFNDNASKSLVFNHIKKTTDDLDKIVFDIHQTKQSEYPYDIRSFEFDSKPKALLFLTNSRSSLDESTEIVVESENMNSFAQFIKNHSM